MTVIEQVSRIDGDLKATRLAQVREYQVKFANTIRKMQRRGITDPSLDPMITAGALTAMTRSFAETWLAVGAVHYDFNAAVEQVATLHVKILLSKPETPEPSGRRRKRPTTT
jgi:hypothetical protein